jgi:hypothetical protein
MAGRRFGDGTCGGVHPDPPAGLPPRRTPSAPGRRAGGRSDRGSNGSLAAFLIGVAVIAGLIGFTLNRVTAGDDQPAAAAKPTADAAAAGALTGLTAEQVAIRLRDVGVPLHTAVVYDASSDPNQLLGKPGGYASKIAFTDARTGVSPARVTTKDPVEQGGSIEVFADQATASSRMQQLRTVTASSQLLQESDFQQGGVVLRVSRYFSATDANGYRDALAALAAGSGRAPAAVTATPGTPTAAAATATAGTTATAPDRAD